MPVMKYIQCWIGANNMQDLATGRHILKFDQELKNYVQSYTYNVYTYIVHEVVNWIPRQLVLEPHLCMKAMRLGKNIFP